MRYVALMVVLALAGCGGGDKPADHPTGVGAPADTDAGQSANTGPTTTTTVLMGDAGELQGTKLTTTQNPVTLDGGSTAPPPPTGDKDPGRRNEDIVTIIRTHRDEARACYDAALKTHPGIEGNIYISWKLDPKGTVVTTGTDDSKSDIHDANLVKCIGDVIRKIPWAASQRGVESTMGYPFNFHPHGTTH